MPVPRLQAQGCFQVRGELQDLFYLRWFGRDFEVMARQYVPAVSPYEICQALLERQAGTSNSAKGFSIPRNNRQAIFPHEHTEARAYRGHLNLRAVETIFNLRLHIL